jgi:FtsP/CotA-like multicopper oxidase with cupredoxin domain
MPNPTFRLPRRFKVAGIVAIFLLLSATAWAAIPGVSGPNFSFTAKSGHISVGDPDSLIFWGYANGAGPVQYPGPTMIVTAGQQITVALTNELGTPVSIVFPGQVVEASGGVPGLLTREALNADDPATVVNESTVTYTFTPAEPGTYLYHSGTRPDLQVEMGLVGALIVRPANFDAQNPTAYGDARTGYDQEYLFLLTEMDKRVHDLVETGRISQVDTSDFFPVHWFINGRSSPDTLAPAGTGLLPNQPYDSLVRMNPGERLLLRFVGAGRDLHPFHLHGNNFFILARDGRLLESAPAAELPVEIGTVPDIAVSDFTITVLPGMTADGIFTWTGRDLGWDIYGVNDPNNPGFNPHGCDTPAGYDTVTNEYCPDHDKPFPVILPDLKDLTFGQFYSGSPFLGAAGSLPPGEGGFNPNAGFFYMWHSHSEKELTSNDIFPGGMMTFLVVEKPVAAIP